MVKEDSFGLFGWVGRGSWQERKEGAGRGSEDGAGKGAPPERAEQRGASEGCGSLVNSRPGSGAFLTLEIFAGWVSCGLWEWGTGLWIFGGMFCEGFWLLRWGGAWIWTVKILLLYLYNNLKQSD